MPRAPAASPSSTPRPAAAAYTDELADLFLTLPILAAFGRRYSTVPHPARPGVYQALVESYVKWRGQRELPRIGILDWKEVPTYAEFVLFQEYFRAQGLECVITDPREVEYRQGKLWAGDFHITLIYKRVLISELIERGGLDQPVIRAVRDRAVCMVNPFRCKPLYKKASLAVLSDEANLRLFTPEQQEAIREHIPWTRVVQERHTTRDGHPVDLVPHILENRDRLVLKPNDDYGGKGIVLGWTVDLSSPRRGGRVGTGHALRRAGAGDVASRSRFPFWSRARSTSASGCAGHGLPFVCLGDHVEGCLIAHRHRPAAERHGRRRLHGAGTFIIEPR